MPDKFLSNFKLRSKRSLVIFLISMTIIFPILIFNAPVDFGKAHSNLAIPKEIFSLWNDTSPTLDGSIEFDARDMSTEWSSAAVYDMYEETVSPSAKVLLQNSDTNLFIAFDMTEYQTDPNPEFYGCAVYLDRNHNGLLDNSDAAIVYYHIGNGTEYVAFRQYTESIGDWLTTDTSTLGVALSNNVVVYSDFTDSYFESTAHRQYEIRIPLTVLQASPGDITGIGLEAFYNYHIADGTTTWPGYETDPYWIWLTPEGWGDLYLGKSSDYADYVIEDNRNIEFDADEFAIGENNNTYLVTGDINGDGDQELIVGSNRMVSGEENLLTIFDYSGGELTQIWCSKSFPSHQANMPLPLGITTYDFDSNGEDEIYIVGITQHVFRLYDWNSTGIPNFDSSSNCFSYSQSLTGTVDIGDVDNDGNVELVVGASDGRVVVVQYTIGTDTFSQKHTHGPATLLGSPVTRIQALEVADMDDDTLFELIYAGQTTTNDTLGTAAIQIVERSLFNYADNPSPGDDDLPLASSATTEDEHIHSILVGDVDNDADTEIVIVGKDYLRIFGPQTFTNPSPPIELLINSSSFDMSGGVTLGDINNDGNDELIFGAANGTIYFATITDSGSDSLSYSEEWSNDVGHSPGYREAMTVIDIDLDTENELILGDSFGQIMTIGNGTAPSVTITSPSYGSSRTDMIVAVSWSATDDFAMHHFDIYVNETFYGKVGGSQRGATLSLGEG
ncbi:MAG: hypothetical protein FK733_19570, partial [Asgard group archaeon]|nr:hypothetical protein [Asgard group archaeon]